MNNQHGINIWSLLILSIMCLSQLMGIQTAQAKQCFIDAKQAHAYLISQQQLAKQSEESAQKNQLININSATESELTLLNGIGSTKAKEIILYREAFGPFITVNALAKVQGIGERTVAKNRDRLTVK